jgi:hypothetical protein
LISAEHEPKSFPVRVLGLFSKPYLETTGSERASVDALSGAYSMSNPPKHLSREELHEILVELSSPLTGYAGRIKGDSLGRDRFYFLRDLRLDD